jgi:hypothetical protein
MATRPDRRSATTSHCRQILICSQDCCITSSPSGTPRSHVPRGQDEIERCGAPGRGYSHRTHLKRYASIRVAWRRLRAYDSNQMKPAMNSASDGPMIRIFPVGDTEPELRKSLSEWFQREFGQTGFTWAPPDYYAIMEVEGELIGRLGIFDREVEVAGTRMRVGGNWRGDYQVRMAVPRHRAQPPDLRHRFHARRTRRQVRIAPLPAGGSSSLREARMGPRGWPYAVLAAVRNHHLSSRYNDSEVHRTGLACRNDRYMRFALVGSR